MLSVISVTGILSSINSHVVILLPWLSGRVSQEMTFMSFPWARADRITPRAVPSQRRQAFRHYSVSLRYPRLQEGPLHAPQAAYSFPHPHQLLLLPHQAQTFLVL